MILLFTCPNCRPAPITRPVPSRGNRNHSPSPSARDFPQPLQGLLGRQVGRIAGIGIFPVIDPPWGALIQIYRKSALIFPTAIPPAAPEGTPPRRFWRPTKKDISLPPHADNRLFQSPGLYPRGVAAQSTPVPATRRKPRYLYNLTCGKKTTRFTALSSR